MAVVVILSGHAGSGKSTLARKLERAGYTIVGTRALLAQKLGPIAPTRSALIAEGDARDKRGAAWIVDEVAAASNRGARSVCLDRVRKPEQVAALRSRFGSYIFHVHLLASRDVLRARHRHRRPSGAQDVPFEALLDIDAGYDAALSALADLVVHTDQLDEEKTFRLVTGKIMRLPGEIRSAS